jgi:hypothetical protein
MEQRANETTWSLRLAMAGGALVLAGGSAQAAFVQPSLPAGAGYRIIFTTSGTTQATSNNIADYNGFVTTQAAMNASLPATTWRAIASTASVAASAQADCAPVSCASLPIFNVNGTKVADSLADFFDGTILTALRVNQSGGTIPTDLGAVKVWTGSTDNGSPATSGMLGASDVRTGDAVRTIGGFYMDTRMTWPSSFLFRLYGISDALSIPTPVPAPGGLAMMLLGLGALGGLAFRRTRTPD